MRITEGERIADVRVDGDSFPCPKCEGRCTRAKGVAVQVGARGQPMWDCPRCGRGWAKIPYLYEVNGRAVQNVDDSVGTVVGVDNDCWKVQLPDGRVVHWNMMWSTIL